MKNYYSFINESKIINFPGTYKVGDRVILKDDVDGYDNIDNKTGTIKTGRDVVIPMDWTKEQTMAWVGDRTAELCYEITLDEYQGIANYNIFVPESLIKCLEKDKEEYFRKKEENKFRMTEFDPYGEEDWDD